MINLLKNDDVLVKNYISVSISCEGAEIELESSELSFDELEDKFFEIHAKLQTNDKKHPEEVNLQ